MTQSHMEGRPELTSLEWLTVRDIANHLHASESTVRRWIRTERIVAKFFGGRIGYRITRAELDKFLRHSSRRPKQRVGGIPEAMSQD